MDRTIAGARLLLSLVSPFGKPGGMSHSSCRQIIFINKRDESNIVGPLTGHAPTLAIDDDARGSQCVDTI